MSQLVLPFEAKEKVASANPFLHVMGVMTMAVFAAAIATTERPTVAASHRCEEEAQRSFTLFSVCSVSMLGSVEAKGGHQIPWSLSLHLTAFRQGLSHRAWT